MFTLVLLSLKVVISIANTSGSLSPLISQLGVLVNISERDRTGQVITVLTTNKRDSLLEQIGISTYTHLENLSILFTYPGH